MFAKSLGISSFILLLAAMTSGFARADDDYRCGERLCHDDQADETRRLNQMQLDDPGAGINAVPPPEYAHGEDQGYAADDDMREPDGPYSSDDDDAAPEYDDIVPCDDPSYPADADPQAEESDAEDKPRHDDD